MSRSAIATNVQISKSRNHLCKADRLAHICDIRRTRGFDKILPNMGKHDIQQRSQFPFLMKILSNVSIAKWAKTFKHVSSVKDVDTIRIILK